MSDSNTSLPIRTEANGDVVVKLGDGTTPSQQASVDASGRLVSRITDTAGNSLTSTSNSLNVNMTNSLSTGVADKTAFTYGTTVQTVMGGVFQDTSPTLSAGTQGALRLTTNRAMHVNLRDASGNEKLGSSTSANSIPVVIASDQAAVPVSQSGTWTVQPGNTQNTTAWLVQDSADGPVGAGTAAGKSMLGGLVFNSAAPTPSSGQQVALQGDSAGNLKVNLATAIPAGSANIGNVGVLVGGSANAITNPLFVTNVDALGTSVDSYQTSAALAAAASVNLDYTVTSAKTWYGQQVWATGSGKIKVVVAFETAAASGVFNTFWVGFNSTAEPNILIPLPPTKTQVTGAKVRVTITNNDKTSFDVYETLSGTEI